VSVGILSDAVIAWYTPTGRISMKNEENAKTKNNDLLAHAQGNVLEV
jgi:hypothetical protein